MELIANNIYVRFGTKNVLDGLSLMLSSPALVMLLGRNGSGKTTLFRSLLGIQRLTSGRILIDKQDLLCLNDREKSRYLSYVPQKNTAQNNFTVKEYVMLGWTSSLSLFQVPNKAQKEQTQRVLEEFQLEHLSCHSFATLSGGEQQKATLARARLLSSAWMLLDEPLTGLDYVNQHLFMKQLLSYQRGEGQGIFMSVHDPNIALCYADVVLILDQGKIICELDRTEEQFAEQLLASLNEICEGHLMLLRGADSVQFAWKE